MASNKKLYKDVVNTFGHGPQVDVAVREASSLIGEIQKYKLMRPHNVPQAIADMEIMCNQLRIIFLGVNDIKKERLSRLQELINQKIR
ncbi:MAG: hypothetical protein KAS66_10510 [Candidatus Omnitrophica bacterium]|nr:hypothetical protein [Candidatus Omnitrophota bacterium]